MKKHHNIINGLVGIGAILLVASTALFAGCATAHPPIRWAGDWIRDNEANGKTEEIEYGFRADGVMVWRLK